MHDNLFNFLYLTYEYIYHIIQWYGANAKRESSAFHFRQYFHTHLNMSVKYYFLLTLLYC